MFKFTSHSIVNHYFVSEIYQPLSYFTSIWLVAGANFPPWFALLEERKIALFFLEIHHTPLRDSNVLFQLRFLKLFYTVLIGERSETLKKICSKQLKSRILRGLYDRKVLSV